MSIPAPLIIASPEKGIKVDAAVIAASFRKEIKDKVERLKKDGIGAYVLRCFALLHGSIHQTTGILTLHLSSCPSPGRNSGQ
jgi:hypothetical protein